MRRIASVFQSSTKSHGNKIFQSGAVNLRVEGVSVESVSKACVCVCERSKVILPGKELPVRCTIVVVILFVVSAFVRLRSLENTRLPLGVGGGLGGSPMSTPDVARSYDRSYDLELRLRELRLSVSLLFPPCPSLPHK